jgi:hypothetical protein
VITETTFPSLDAASREQPYLKFKMLAESVDYKVEANPIGGAFDQKQKEWGINAFRLIIDGVPTPSVHKIESFTVKQGVKRLYVGGQRLPQIEPTKIEFPNIIASIAEQGAAPIFDWYKKFVVKGQPDPNAERQGAIEFLSPDRQRVLLRIELFEVGLASAAIIPSQANQNATKTCKFELYVGRMEIDFAGSTGLD